MNATLLDGNVLSKKLRETFKTRTDELIKKGVRPGLAVILVGEDAASKVYVGNKVAACEKVGFYSEKYVFDAKSMPEEVLLKIKELNENAQIHGILVQLPLPKHFDVETVLSAICLEKDVDGFRAENLGALAQNLPCFIPCTPNGVMRFLEDAQIDVKGKEAVVVGRSNIVGKPMAMLLTNAGATVTICHSQTRDLKAHCLRADILVAAIGKPKMITGEMVKTGAIVIDVGINRILDGENAGKLCGDVDFASVVNKASFVTPVPGGVGPMTITMLLANTLQSAEKGV